MVKLDIPFIGRLHYWLGYIGNANKLAVWWHNHEVMLADGVSEPIIGYSSMLRMLEVSDPFREILSEYHYVKTNENDEDYNCLIFDRVNDCVFYGSYAEYIHDLNSINEHTHLESDLPIRYNHLENSEHTAKPSNPYRRPSMIAFRELNQWINMHQDALSPTIN